MEFVDAIQYIRDNKFTENKQYEWINPILRKTLKNQLTELDIHHLICSITKSEAEYIETADEECATISNNDSADISKLLEISEVKNYGLVDIHEPIKLNDGLNIFYGKNGVGKSSLFKALCSVLGFDSFKKCTPNINNSNRNMYCRIKVIDKNSNEIELESCNVATSRLNIKLFDNFISNYIVTNDQKNEFQVPYLKQQYFYILRDVLEEVQNKIANEGSMLESRVKFTCEMLEDELNLTDMTYTEIETITKDVVYSEEDREKLEELEKEKSILKFDTTNILKKSYEDRLEEITTVLKELCIENDKADKKEFTFKFDRQYFSNYNNNLKDYYIAKRIFEGDNIKNLGNFIPKDWVGNKLWEIFIAASITFIKTLNNEDQLTYTKEKCPYCNQDLQGKSKDLIIAYQNINTTYKEKIKKIEKSFEDYEQEINNVIKLIDQFDKICNNINQLIDKKLELDKDTLKFIFKKILTKIEKHQEIDNFYLGDYENITEILISTKTIIEEKLVTLEKVIKNKAEVLKKLDEEITKLKIKRKIHNNYDIIKNIIKDLECIEDIDKKSIHITTLKKNLSRLENSFSRDSSMKIFTEKLHLEYSQLDLTPPTMLSIKPQKDRRQCRIGDHKISDIYSEGELKIHSLAEFFAEAEIDNFKGVYIFDDPVNSLDYERIEYVKDRILKLIVEGNQVLVFTHNIYFLNSLIATEKDKINEVVKSNNQIYILSETVLSNKERQIKQYNQKIKKRLDLFRNMIPHEIDICDISSVYDLMSGCLESFVENILLNGLISRYRPNIRMFSLLELKALNNDLIDKIYHLYNSTSRYGNRHNSPVEALSPTYEKLEIDYKLFEEILNYK